MGLVLLAAFIAVPLLEIAVFIQVGEIVGLGMTLALVVLTAILGTWQLRAQGLATLGRLRSQLDRGVMPARELFDGVCLIFAGALLLTPGFVTDSVGFLLFLAPFRAALRHMLGRRLEQSAKAGGQQGPGQAQWGRVWVQGEEIRGGDFRQSSARRPGSQRSDIIDGEYQDVTPGSGAPSSGAPSSGPPSSGSKATDPELPSRDPTNEQTK